MVMASAGGNMANDLLPFGYARELNHTISLPFGDEQRGTTSDT
jgi:hypothetical protein